MALEIEIDRFKNPLALELTVLGFGGSNNETVNYRLLVVVNLDILMCAVTDKLKFKPKSLYLLSSGMAVSQIIINDFSS